MTELSEEIRRELTAMREVIALALLIVIVPALAPVVLAQELRADTKAPETAYVVVLKNGKRIPARTRPVNAFGKIRYVDASGTSRVLSVSKIDVVATRELNSQVPTRGRVGTLSVGGELIRVKPTETVDTDRNSADAEKKQDRSVKVYSATWCPHCKNLKKFLADIHKETMNDESDEG